MHMIVRDLRCTATTACFDEVHEALSGLWDDAPEVDGADRMLFETALVEIVGNLVEHARTHEGEPVTIEGHVAVHPDRVEACLTDDGVAAELDLSAATPAADDFAEGGRGLALAKAVADVTYARTESANVWRVTRRRSG
ncbi:MAG TPA: ATP-binding protein [Pseudonocardia sp.]